MKTGIVTIQSVNYGNRLQNYALQQVLAGFGFNVESLRREPYGLPQRLKRVVRRAIKDDKTTAFHRFDTANVAMSSWVLSQNRISPSLISAYDAFVIGSDQVWNPDFDFNSELEYLPMVPPAKKIAYAASFGVSRLDTNLERTAKLLNDIPCISVREQAGADIVAGLTGREVPVVLDPTMLLTVKDWSVVSAKPKAVASSKPFLFKYVLGDDVNEVRIAAIAAKRGYEVIDVMDDSLKVGPAEFVWLVANSSLVCTDSFHASVFALLHHKPLAIFERVSSDKDMSSRFDTLCSLFGLVGHRSNENDFGCDAVFGTDWKAFECRLAELREFSLNWLKESLGDVSHG